VEKKETHDSVLELWIFYCWVQNS